MADMSATLPLPSLTSWAYDGTRGVLNLLTAEGKLLGWNVAAQAFTYTLDLGFKPSSADVSANGRYLVVGDSTIHLTSGPVAVDKTYEAQLLRIDLTDLSRSVMSFKVTSFESGVADVTAASDGRVLVTMAVNGSGWGGVRALDLGVTGTGLTAARLNSLSVPDRSSLLGSENDRFVLVQHVYSTPSQATLYDASSGTLVAQSDAHDLGVSAQWGTGDISEARGQIVAVGSRTLVFDLQMTAKADLTSYDRYGAITGAAFSPDGARLYLWHGEESHVTVLETVTWTEQGNLDFVLTTPPPAYNSDLTMDITADGRLLIMESGGTIELVDIPARLNTQLTPVQLTGGGGADILRGGSANDSLAGGDGLNVVRGGFGDDTIHGGAQFDDLHGNQGADVMRGAGGDDWVVGGKGNDLLFGDEGSDIVYGNTGRDTVDGGAGNDWVRGGQGDDIVRGGPGDDWIAGDRGADVLYGGDGADTFYTFRDAGFDQVVDFKIAEGDRVQLLPGTIYTVSQRGADTVILMEGVGRMALSDVQLSTLPEGWLFEA